jgi:hypothetical protein
MDTNFIVLATLTAFAILDLAAVLMAAVVFKRALDRLDAISRAPPDIAVTALERALSRLEAIVRDPDAAPPA